MKTILTAFLISYYTIEIAFIPDAIKTLLKYPRGKRMKPLDCVTCFSFWVAACLYFLPSEITQFCLITFGAGFLGNFLNIKK